MGFLRKRILFPLLLAISLAAACGVLSSQPAPFAEWHAGIAPRVASIPATELAALSLREMGEIPNGDLNYDIANYWGIYRIGADLLKPALIEHAGGSATTIGVVDIGFKPSHPALKNRISATHFPTQRSKGISHGTHVAGLIASSGSYSVGEHANIKLALSTVSSHQRDDTQVTNEPKDFQTRLLTATQYLTEHAKTRIINASVNYGEDADFAIQLEALLRDKNIIYVNAVGNDSIDLRREKRELLNEQHGVLHIGSLHPSHATAPDSNYGKALFLSAPGVDIFSLAAGVRRTAVPGTKYSSHAHEQLGAIELVSQNGTSMAAPFVSGTIGVMLSLNPKLSRKQIIEILRVTAIDLGAPGRDIYYGWGLVNAYAASQLALQLKNGETIESGLAELQHYSSQHARKGMELVEQLITERNADLVIVASNEVRKAYFLDPNNMERRALQYAFHKHFGFFEDALAIANDIAIATGDEKYLAELIEAKVQDEWVLRARELARKGKFLQRHTALLQHDDIRSQAKDGADLLQEMSDNRQSFVDVFRKQIELTEALAPKINTEDDLRYLYQQYLQETREKAKQFYAKILFSAYPQQSVTRNALDHRPLYQGFIDEFLAQDPNLESTRAIATIVSSWQYDFGVTNERLQAFLKHNNADIRQHAKEILTVIRDLQ